LQLVVVRKDEFATFELLCRVFAGDPDVRIVWDRRTAQRRREPQSTDAERRSGSDRRRVSKPWSQLNYVIVNASA